MTGSRGAEPEPGIWMAGFTTGEIDPGRDGRRPYVGLRMAGLQAPVPRERLQADRRTDRLEVLRVAHGSNPSYLTPEEKAAVEEMIGGWPDPIGGADAWCRPVG
ncbi:hypothetical protein [Pseudonocardia acidicola]|uniref:Uncharacterized protein n=1 Tax=Pseudonocardia acidicola TaxID=2724939 RepID=A0ABX1S6J5_9PSEU|nr:hypothetical protein [Pseudonocardia acidicola]NMH95758.1 hypothetical protein [Pseudonocardia acidicola]